MAYTSITNNTISNSSTPIYSITSTDVGWTTSAATITWDTPSSDITKEHVTLLKQLLKKRTKRELNDLASAIAESIDGDAKTVRTLLKLFPALLALEEITEALEGE